jgi:hypothetical protein
MTSANAIRSSARYVQSILAPSVVYNLPLEANCYGTGEGEGDRDEREPATGEGDVGVLEAP